MPSWLRTTTRHGSCAMHSRKGYSRRRCGDGWHDGRGPGCENGQVGVKSQKFDPRAALERSRSDPLLGAFFAVSGAPGRALEGCEPAEAAGHAVRPPPRARAAARRRRCDVDTAQRLGAAALRRRVGLGHRAVLVDVDVVQAPPCAAPRALSKQTSGLLARGACALAERAGCRRAGSGSRAAAAGSGAAHRTWRASCRGRPRRTWRRRRPR